jgi:hypothetical protein
MARAHYPILDEAQAQSHKLKTAGRVLDHDHLKKKEPSQYRYHSIPGKISSLIARNQSRHKFNIDIRIDVSILKNTGLGGYLHAKTSLQARPPTLRLTQSFQF